VCLYVTSFKIAHLLTGTDIQSFDDITAQSP